MDEDARSREPRLMTVGDLVVLVTSVAVAMSLEWSTWWPRHRIGNCTPQPDWYKAVEDLAEWTQMGLLAMGPVVIARRARHGGPLRPAEFLALAIGASKLVRNLIHIPALGIMGYSWRGTPYVEDENFLPTWHFCVFLAAMSSVALAVRFREPLVRASWVTGVLLVGAYVATIPLEFARYRLWGWADWWDSPPWVNRIWADATPEAARLLSALSETWIIALTSVPLVLAVLAAARRDRARRTWVEWACFSIALVAVLAGWVQDYGGNYAVLGKPLFGDRTPASAGVPADPDDATMTGMPPHGDRTRLIIGIVTSDPVKLTVGLVLAVMLVRRFVRPLGQWLGLMGEDFPA